MTTIRDVAQRAQVAASTVSRVINNDPAVSSVVRTAVLAAIEDLQYRPNVIARNLRTARTRTLGLLVPDLRNSEVAATAILGAESAAQAHGYALVVADSRHDPMIEMLSLTNLLERRIDGLLCNPMLSLESVHALVERAGVPTVLFGQSAAHDLLPTTVLNFTAATEEAIDHLMELGHQHIATITHASDINLEASVGWGAQFIHHVLRARGIESDDQYNWLVRSTEECTQLIRDRFTKGNRPTAILVRPLYLVPAAIAGIRTAGARMPRDVSLIAFGEADWVRVFKPPLSVIAADIAAHLNAATLRLINLIEREDDTQIVREHYGQYIRRQSVAPLQGRPDGASRRAGRSDGIIEAAL
jgi:LacI family transcriptional regulator